MNPLFMDGAPSPAPEEPGLIRRCMRVFGVVAGLFTIDLFRRRRAQLKIEDGPMWQRFIRGLFYRLLFLPVIVVFVLAALVWIGTHPFRLNVASDPSSVGAYYDPVNFTSADGTRLEAWFVPMLDARSVVEQKEKVLKAKYPAVVLVHDYGNNRSQMLPLVRPLHEAGYIVLVIALRGSSGSIMTGTTFGLRESADVKAAVDMLRRRNGVDPNRIAVLGVGTGANAALLAATDDDVIAALILDHPMIDVNEMICDYLNPPQPWLNWARPISKWIFEVAYKVDADDLEFRRCKAAVRGRPVLMFDSRLNENTPFQRRAIKQTCDFLDRHMKSKRGETNVAGTESN